MQERNRIFLSFFPFPIKIGKRWYFLQLQNLFLFGFKMHVFKSVYKLLDTSKYRMFADGFPIRKQKKK